MKIPNNTKYWQNLAADKIIGQNAYPEDELFSLTQQGMSVLDIGCGNGALAEHMTERGYEVTGVDVNEQAIQANRKRSKGIKFVQADIAQRLPFDDNSFDIIVMGFVLVSFVSEDDREKLIEEMTRVLKPSGYIWINEALVSPDYKLRYKLAEPYLEGEHSFFVFADGGLTSRVTTPAQVEQALEDGLVARTSCHFTMPQLVDMFCEYEAVYSKESEIVSPNSGSAIRMVVMIFKKK